MAEQEIHPTLTFQRKKRKDAGRSNKDKWYAAGVAAAMTTPEERTAIWRSAYAEGFCDGWKRARRE